MTTFLKTIFSGTLLVVLVLPTVTHALPGAPCLTGGAAAGWKMGIDCANSTSDLENTKISSIIRAFMMWSLALVGILSVAAFVVAGVLYLTAAGDDDQITRAKRALRYAIIGTILALSGLVVIKAIDAALSGKSTF